MQLERCRHQIHPARKPNQNAYIERFNRSYRDQVLKPHIFSALSQVRDLSWAWLLSYNEERQPSRWGISRHSSRKSALDLCP
ncbi:MAG: transposase [Pyrinomonadaceae bacterium]|nr:transposase [Pyrinomonadaceae bacterium]